MDSMYIKNYSEDFYLNYERGREIKTKEVVIENVINNKVMQIGNSRTQRFQATFDNSYGLAWQFIHIGNRQPSQENILSNDVVFIQHINTGGYLFANYNYLIGLPILMLLSHKRQEGGYSELGSFWQIQSEGMLPFAQITFNEKVYLKNLYTDSYI